MEVVNLLAILIGICLPFNLNVFGFIVSPQRSVSTADVAVALVELLSRRGKGELDGFAVACCCTPAAGRSGHDE